MLYISLAGLPILFAGLAAATADLLGALLAATLSGSSSFRWP